MRSAKRREPIYGLKWAIAQVESPGTKAFTRSEVARWIGQLPLRDVVISTERTHFDYQPGWPRIHQLSAIPLLTVAGDRFGYFMRIMAIKAP